MKFIILFLIISTNSFATSISHSFSPSQKIEAQKINENFNDLNKTISSGQSKTVIYSCMFDDGNNGEGGTGAWNYTMVPSVQSRCQTWIDLPGTTLSVADGDNIDIPIKSGIFAGLPNCQWGYLRSGTGSLSSGGRTAWYRFDQSSATLAKFESCYAGENACSPYHASFSIICTGEAP